MKFGLIMIGLVGLLSMSKPKSEAAEQGWKNALKPIGAAAPAITLAAHGEARYAILVPANPDAKEARAATELAKWLKESSNADFRVVKEGTVTLSQRFISVGGTQALQKAQLPQSRVALNPEGVAIGQKGGNLYLFGGSRRGPLYAVMGFLEADLGFRWYSVDSTVIPKLPTLVVSVVPRVENPKLMDERNPYYFDAFGNADWHIHNRLNSPRSEISAELGGNMSFATGPRGSLMVHTFNQLVPKEQYFETHPEYYALRDGVRHSDGLCETNSEVQKIAIASAFEALRMTPDATEINVSRLDGVAVCKCPNCKSVNEENKSDAGSLIVLTNVVADAIAKEFPKALVGTIAYSDSIEPPAKVRPRDNVLIRVCNDQHSWKYPLVSFTEGNAPETVGYRKTLDGWAAISRHIGIWEYTSNYDHYTAPMPNMHLLAPQLKYYIEHNVTGMMFQGDYSGPYSDRATMRMWVMAKLLWNPTLDTDALVRDFNYGYYGKAAATIQAYDELLNKVSAPYRSQALPNGIRFPTTVGFFTTDFVNQSLALFERAEVLAKDSPTLLNRVQIAKLAVQYVILSRRKDFSTEEYADTLKQFSRVAMANGLRYLKEPPGPDLPQKLAYFESKLRGRQPPVVPLPGTIAAMVPKGTEAQNVIDVHLDEFALWFEGDLVFKVDDPLASKGQAARTTGKTSQWTVQYPLKEIDDLEEDSWRVYLIARVDSKDGATKTGNVLNCGIYDTQKKVWVTEIAKTMEEIGDGQYRVIDMGAKPLKNSYMVYAAPMPNPNVEYLYIERIIFVRETAKP